MVEERRRLVTPQLVAEISRAEWTWAKTYAETAPHWYIVRDKYPGLFWRLARAIDLHGIRQEFRNSGQFNYYLTIGEFKYWHYKIVLNCAKKDDY